MTMLTETTMLEAVISSALGALTGLAYYWGLWLTIEAFKRKARIWLFPLSYFLRLATVAAVLFGLLPRNFVSIVCFLVFFLVSKVFMIKRVSCRGER